jgi:hypothetical protein
VANGVRKLKARFTSRPGCGCSGSVPAASEKAEGMTVKESVAVAKKLGSVFEREDTANSEKPYGIGMGDQYDPINMGALKQSEIDAHKRGIAEMAPFNSYGPAGPKKVLRDDDDYTRNTGVPWVGGRPRTLKKVASGPQAGARQVTSASEKDIYVTHLMSANEPTWG